MATAEPSWAEYKVICEGPQGQPTFWWGEHSDKGGKLMLKGEVIKIDTKKVFVSATSATLEPVGDAPVWSRKVDAAGKVTHERAKRAA